ncbi:MAG: penicillin acylase family protein, partial [Pirellulaceae bacterium]|nr:penicillin acylase family protein [Pirellulaceae bacterium]
MNTLPTRELLRRLGNGEKIETICSELGISRQDFDDWWSAELARRVPDLQAPIEGNVQAETTIHRDSLGIPHILAENDQDLFFALGMAMAQDRLFQLDYLRRKATGRLSEVLGSSALPDDRIARTVG